jgi:hypothetical protein
MNHQTTNRLPRALGTALLIASSACGGDHAPPVAVSAQPLANDVPRLTLVSTTSDLAAAPRSTYSAIRVGPHGDVLMAEMPGENGILRIVDSTGRLRVTFGRRGEGPGEARGPTPLALTDSSVLAFDTRTLRLSEWDSSGRILGMVSSDIPVVPVAETPDGRWIAAGSSRGMAPVLLDAGTLQPHKLLSSSDSFYQRLRPPAYDIRSNLPPTLGVWDGGFIVGNGSSYQLALYDWQWKLRHVLSRSLPANLPTVNYVNNTVDQLRNSVDGQGRRRSPGDLARIASRTAKQGRAWFSHLSPLGLDDHGRIWVAGPEGDSAYVDVFNAERFLGRLHLPCQEFDSRWAMQGRWLAMVCAPDNPEFPGDAVVKLFRLEEGR